ncbi:hypothetical protein D3C78_956260 [compost metagenome]
MQLPVGLGLQVARQLRQRLCGQAQPFAEPLAQPAGLGQRGQCETALPEVTGCVAGQLAAQLQLGLAAQLGVQLQGQLLDAALQVAVQADMLRLALQLQVERHRQQFRAGVLQFEGALQRALAAGAGQVGDELFDVDAPRQPGQQRLQLLEVGEGAARLGGRGGGALPVHLQALHLQRR